MAVLSSGRRNALPDSSFAVVTGSGASKVRKYPIDTVARARNALSRVSANGTPEEKRAVARAVSRRYPELRGSDFMKKILGRS